MRDGQTSSGNSGWWSGGGGTGWTAISQPPAADFAPEWGKFGCGWQEKGKGKTRPWRGSGSTSPGWKLDHHQQTLMKRSHGTTPDMLASSIGRWGHVIYSNTNQMCKGLVVRGLPAFGRCLHLGMCWWDVPTSQSQVLGQLFHDFERKQKKLKSSM